MPSLREIEKTLTTLWMNREARQWLLADSSQSSPPAAAGALCLEMLPEVDKKGVELYGRLIGYGHQDVMSSMYPYCSQMLGDRWESFVEAYFLQMPPAHFNLNRICQPFAQYVTAHGGIYLERYPYLAELADYEWVELEKMEDPTEIKEGVREAIDSPELFAAWAPIVNQTMTLRHYSYPILEIVERFEQKKKPKKKVAKQDSFVAFFRDPHSHSTRFFDLGETAAKIVEVAATRTTSYQELLQLAIASTPNCAANNTALDFLELIEDLQQSHLFVGSIVV